MEYLITEDQLYQIEHFSRMFEVAADDIKELCSAERSDIVYGFELGKSYRHLRDCFMEMINLKDEIIKRKNEEKV